MSNIIKITLRGIALLWTLLITALIGNVIAQNINGASSATAALNYTMFVAALSWVVCFYGLAAIFIPSLALPVIMITIDSLVVIFSFVCSILLSAKLRAPNCGNISHEHLPKHWIGFGSHDVEKRCREIQASTAFMWFLWATFCGILFFTIKEARSGFGGGSIRSSRPSMSQVSA